MVRAQGVASCARMWQACTAGRLTRPIRPTSAREPTVGWPAASAAGWS